MPVVSITEECPLLQCALGLLCSLLAVQEDEKDIFRALNFNKLNANTKL